MISNRTTPKNKRNINAGEAKYQMIFEITSVAILQSTPQGKFQNVIALMSSPSTN
jgi:hypothetical protein